ncbi:hypothetical protein OJF2_53610 [Aquisphaera giovannonii]|uniref:Uncharacterized protein n=1 Tax=Aquisphaera giovannonii TaxID=406548 RepID=A0A5B9W7W7_9BACT|nr:hypothetical protein [Aquisphaera giovannonii]QEH36776.1 hypothetical protein OJF2_53610 [Aquisphaera giovannonii]
MHDIYDPTPRPELEWEPPREERLLFSRGDILAVVGLCATLFAVASLAWRDEALLAFIAAAVGSLVVVESWLTALGFLNRCPPVSMRLRATIFLAALLPWMVGLSVAVGFILSLFWIYDHLT